MKKLLLLLMMLCLAAPIVTAQNGNPKEILVGEGGNEGGTPGYYAPALIPISAAYYASITTIMIYFRFNLGSVSVEIENQTTGEYSQTLVNATQGVHPFLISGTSGTWTITFTLSSGVQYYGEFDI